MMPLAARRLIALRFSALTMSMSVKPSSMTSPRSTLATLAARANNSAICERVTLS